jgi:hypothetical protein
MHSTHDARAFVFSSFVFAHHGTAGYDVGRTITLTGTVAEIAASNLPGGMVLDAHEAMARCNNRRGTVPFGFR